MSNETPKDSVDKMDKPLPFWFFLILPVYITLMFALLFFLFAGDWAWIEAWLFIITLMINLTVSYYLINKKNPRVIRNRMKIKKIGVTDKTQKSASSDKYILPILGISFFGAMILPAIDYRLKWTTIPLAVEIICLVVMNIGLVIMDVAMVQNAYASKLLDINKEQILIDTGLYGHVRHPLYTGAILWILPMPIALGSWISLIPAALAALALIIRIKFEEDMLIKGMDGYEEYRIRVKYKLFPKIY